MGPDSSQAVVLSGGGTAGDDSRLVSELRVLLLVPQDPSGGGVSVCSGRRPAENTRTASCCSRSQAPCSMWYMQSTSRASGILSSWMAGWRKALARSEQGICSCPIRIWFSDSFTADLQQAVLEEMLGRVLEAGSKLIKVFMQVYGFVLF
ncbi:unnamed protein product [Urochloa humidicola]